MLRKKSAWVALIMVLTLVLSACGGTKKETPSTGAAQPAPTGPKSITLGIWSSPESFDFITNKTTYGSLIISMVYPSLYAMNDKLEYEPRLAESVQINDKQDVFTFKLRKNAKWTDGTPITAADVAYTFQVIAHPDTPSSRRSLIDTIKGLDKNGISETKDFNVSGIKVVDANTIEFTTKTPVDKDAFMEKVGSSVYIIPKSVLEPAVKADLKGLNKAAHVLKPTVFGGAFKIKEYKTDSYVELEANPDYFMGKPKLDKVFVKITSQASFSAALEKGEIDITAGNGIGEVPIVDWEKISALPTMSPNTYVAPSYQYMDINNVKFPDAKVREAFAHAVNRPLIVQRLLKGLGEVLNTPINSMNKYYSKDLQKGLEFNPDLAKKMLTEAGFDFSKEIVILTPTGNQVREQSADIIMANLQAVGIKAKIEKVDFATLQARMKKGEYDLGLIGLSANFDPDFSSQVLATGAFNDRKYKSEKMEDLMAKGKAAVKFDEKKKIYDEAQALFIQDVPFLTLYSTKTLTVVNKRVTGAKPGPNGLTWNAHLWDVTK